jgi:LacI family transcriptional regulator
VPRALSVIGFDGIEMGAFTYPPLTTVGCPIRGIGETAACALIDRLEGRRAEHADILVVPELILRGSTAKAVAP